MIARAMSGADVNFSFRIMTARAAVKHVRGIAHVIEQIEGRPMFVGALQDVTESMEAEEALNKARSELAHVARVTTVSALTASIAHEIISRSRASSPTPALVFECWPPILPTSTAHAKPRGERFAMATALQM
jgi:hypothetical protein